MYHVSAQGVDECMINLHYYYIIYWEKKKNQQSDRVFHLSTMWYCVDWWNRGFPHRALPLSSRVFHLSTKWYCVDWWNRGFHTEPCLFPHEFSIWAPCGTVLTGGTEGSTLSPASFLTIFPSEHHMVKCWLVEQRVPHGAPPNSSNAIGPPWATVLTGGMHDDLNLIQYFGD